MAADGGVELPVDLVIKKPFRVTEWFEFMVGAGPEVQSATEKRTRVGGEVALDCMFWPLARAGLWVEPTYDVVFGGGASHGLRVTAGAMVAW